MTKHGGEISVTDKQPAAPRPKLESLPFGERDTLQAIDQVLAQEHRRAQLRVPPPLEPSSKEHGVWGTTSAAVGGFGESYDAQVAHGTEPNPPEEGGERPAEDARLERELRKTLGRAHVDAADLRIAVRGNQVTLYGCVREPLEKAQIEARARGVPGVASVTSHLSVLGPAPGVR